MSIRGTPRENTHATEQKQVKTLKIGMCRHMEGRASLDYLISGSKLMIKDHPARDFLMTQLSEILLAPNSKRAGTTIRKPTRADGFIVWKSKTSAEYLGYQQIIDTCTN